MEILIKIIVISVLVIAVTVCSYNYFLYRRQWVAFALILFTRLAFFTVLMRELNNGEKLKYNPTELYTRTLKSNTWMMLKFWIWKFDYCIEDTVKFSYMVETTQIYKTEFTLYWNLFVTNGIELNADNIKKYNAVIYNTEFEKHMKNYNDISNLATTLH